MRPRSLAALRLMSNSNLVGSCTGRSAGLAPLAILSTYAGRIECGLDPVEQSKPENLACRRRPGGERRGEEAAS